MSHHPSMNSAVNFGGALRGMWALVWAQRCTTGTIVRWGIGACALGFLMLLTIRSGQEKEWLGWVIGFYVQFLIPLTCLNVCGSMMRAEVQANTLSFLCTRPLRRHTLFLLQYLCHVFWLQLIFLAGTLGLFALGIVKHAEGLGALLPTMLLTQFLAIFAWSALSALLGLLHQPTLHPPSHPHLVGAKRNGGRPVCYLVFNLIDFCRIRAMRCHDYFPRRWCRFVHLP